MKTIEAQLTEAKAELAKSLQDIETLKAELAAVTAVKPDTSAIEAVKAENADLSVKLKAAKDHIAELEAKEQTATAKAAAILAKSGVEPIPADTKKSAEVDIIATYEAMAKGPERRAYLAKHKQILFKHTNK